MQSRGAISKCRATCDDIDMALLDNFLRPGRFEFRQVARGFATAGTATEVQPSRVDAHAADLGRFAKLIALLGFWSGDNIALNLRVQRLTDGEDTPRVLPKEIPLSSGRISWSSSVARR